MPGGSDRRSLKAEGGGRLYKGEERRGPKAGRISWQWERKMCKAQC